MFWVADYGGFEVVEGEEVGELFGCRVLSLLVWLNSAICMGKIPQRRMSRSLDLLNPSCEGANGRFHLL